jgi:hypothetical protein
MGRCCAPQPRPSPHLTPCAADAPPCAPADPVNDAPIVTDRTYTIDEDSTLTATGADRLLAGASDADGDPLTVSITSNPAHGQVTSLDPTTGSFTYTPNGNYNGPDSFGFSVTDGTFTVAKMATITISERAGAAAHHWAGASRGHARATKAPAPSSCAAARWLPARRAGLASLPLPPAPQTLSTTPPPRPT